MFKQSRGFTLIELLVVISILSVLSSILLVSLESARLRARAIMRIQNLVQVRNALEVYATNHGGEYPHTGGNYRSECATWMGTPPLDVYTELINVLVPNYISVFPRDPKMDSVNGKYCYLYKASPNKKLYKFVAYKMDEQKDGIYASMPRFNDPQHLNDAWMVTNKYDFPPGTSACNQTAWQNTNEGLNDPAIYNTYIFHWPVCW